MFSMKFSVFLLVMAGALSYASRTSKYTIGDKVEDFALRNVDGRMVSLSSYSAAEGVIIVFTSLHCPYAEMYEDRIIQLHKKYAPKGYPVMAINPTNPLLFPENSYEHMRARAKAKRYPFAYLQDSTQVVCTRFGASRTPHVFLLDRARIIRYIGSIDDNPENPRAVKKRYLEDAIAALLRGERPNPEITQSIGCPIRIPKQKPSADTAASRR
ncbi:MAG: thioredoxin family protein [Saprospiraceae bacterium]|nr:thioredoxin family protein [Saprospiraceae bacterium]MDW8482913.1 thioredoxin family protein [Saprospiraceae bacterium]